MPVKVRLGQNWYTYSEVGTLDRDIAAAEIVLAQAEKSTAMKRRNLDNLRAARPVLADEVGRMRDSQRVGSRRGKAEETDK